MDEQKERYLQGKLSKEESKAYIQSLSAEERKGLATDLGIQDGLNDQFRKELRKTVAGFEQKTNSARKINLGYISIAASILIASTILLFFLKKEQSLFDQYYKPYPNYEVTTLRGEEVATTRQKAYQAYDKNDFIQSISLFNQLDTFQISDRFFRGISSIESGQYEIAIIDLSYVSSDSTSEYSSAAKWYLALIHMNNGNVADARLLLKELDKGNSEYSVNANQLLEKL